MRRIARSAILALATAALAGCYVVPYGPRYAYGPGYYHPYYR